MSINKLSFNNSTTTITCCTDQGYLVYTLSPQLEYIKRRDVGGLGIAKNYNNTNLIILVGGGPHPFSSRDAFVLYDQFEENQIIKIDMKEPIKDVFINTENNIVVVLEKKVSVFNWDGACVDTKLTYCNPHGLCVTHSGNNGDTVTNIVVTLGTKKGDIAIWDYSSATDNYKSIEAHQTNIEALAINKDGTLIATSSEVGTLIRVYDIKTKQLKFEFRRGTSQSTIYDLAFNTNSTKLACSSSHGTIHFFSLENNTNTNTKSMISGYGSYVSSYFDSQWCFKSFNINNTNKSICSFDDHDNLHVIAYDGLYYKIGYNAEELCILTQGNLHINNK